MVLTPSARAAFRPRPPAPRTVHIIGAGLTGLALAGLLGQAGHAVVVHEARTHAAVRAADATHGRRISVDLSARALRVLSTLSVWPSLAAQCRRVRARRVHHHDGAETVLPFVGGVVHTTSRAALRAGLQSAVDALPAVTVRYGSALGAVDLAARQVSLGGAPHDLDRIVLLGCDGAGSQVRALVEQDTETVFRRAVLPHSFRPVRLPGLALARDEMHLWQHPRAVLAAQPAEGGFSGALITDAAGWAALGTAPARVLAAWFPSLSALAGDLAGQLSAAPLLPVRQITGSRWRAERFEALVLGDAAHTMAPFLGQGLNCALEDCRLLCDAIGRAPGWRTALRRFESRRVPDALAIVEMSAQNYPELSRPERARDERLREASLLAEPRFVPFHSLVCFSELPYREVLGRRAAQLARCGVEP